MANGNVMGLLGNFIQQNPNIFNQLQPPMTSVTDAFPNAGATGTIEDRTGTIDVPGTNPGGQFVQPRRPDPFGLIALPDLSLGNNPSLPNTRFGAGVRRIVDPSVQPTLIQDQMFQPPMQQPVQNQMPVANSFLEQLQQSTQSLNNQIRNVVPQNRFVGNQFQMPFNFGGGYGYSPSNFTYTPGAFNQYGNIPMTGNIPSNVATTTIQDRGGEGDVGGIFGGVQGQNDPDNPNNQQDSYTRNPDGSITKFDASENQFSNFMPSDINLSLPDLLFANVLNLPTIPNLVKGLLDGSLGMGDGGDRTTGFEGTGTGQIGSTGPTAYSQARALAAVKAAEEAAAGQQQEGNQGNQGGASGGPIGGSQKDRFGKGTAGS